MEMTAYEKRCPDGRFGHDCLLTVSYTHCSWRDETHAENYDVLCEEVANISIVVTELQCADKLDGTYLRLSSSSRTHHTYVPSELFFVATLRIFPN